MNFNEHFNLKGKHAFLSASKYHWTNYDDSKLDFTYMASLEAQRGVELHDLAARLITHKVRLPRSNRTLNQYVNDAIGFDMSPEVVLYYSDYAFGTADTIAFKKDFLRIHDLKTGVTPANMRQLQIYAALFCMEYGYKPHEIGIELRLYQKDEVLISNPEVPDIVVIMDKIKRFSKRIENLQKGV